MPQKEEGNKTKGLDDVLMLLNRGFSQNFIASFTKPITWVLVSITFSVVGMSVWQFAVREVTKQDLGRADVTDIAKKNAEVIRAQLIRSVSATYALGSFIRVDDKNVTRDGFDQIAESLVETFGGITNLQFQPFGVVSQIYPIAGSESAIGHALFLDPNRIESATNTASSGSLTFMGPISLVQGGVGVIARFPIFTKYSPEFLPPVGAWWPEWQHGCCEGMEMASGVSFPGPPEADGSPTYFWGFSSMLTLVEKLVEDLNLQDLEHKYKYQIVDLVPHSSIDSSGIFFHSPNMLPDEELKDPVASPINYAEAGVQWEFRMVPVDGWPGLSADFAIQLTLLLVGAVLSAVSRMINISVAFTQKMARQMLKDIQFAARPSMIQEMGKTDSISV